MEVFILLIVVLQIFLSIYRLNYGLCFLIAIRILIPDAARVIFIDTSLNTFCTIILSLVVALYFIWGFIPKKNINDKMIKFIAFYYLISLFVAIFPNEVPFSYQFSALNQFIITQMLPVFLAVLIIQKKEDYVLLMKVFAISFLICAFYGIYSWIFSDFRYNLSFVDFFGYARVWDLNSEMGGIQGRIYGTFSDSFSYAQVVPIVFVFMWGISKRFKYKINTVLLVLLGINVLLTVRRAPIVTTLIFFLSLFYFESTKLKIRYLKYIIVFLVITILAIEFIPYLVKFKTILESSLYFWDDSVSDKNDVSGSSVSFRSFQLQRTLEIIKDDMLLGKGWGYNYYHPHPEMIGWESIVFLILGQWGIFGIILWTYLFWFMYKYSIKNYQNVLYQKCFIISSITLCLLTGTAYYVFIFLGIVLFNKANLLNVNQTIVKISNSH